MQLTKKEIIEELKKYDIHATLRPRKAILVNLLERVREEHKKGVLTSKVTHMDDIYYHCEKELDPRKPEGILDRFMGGILLVITKVFIAIIALEFLNASTLDLPPGEFFGVLGVLFLLIGIPIRVWLWEREMK